MSKSRILVVWSNYYQELAEQQLASCLKLLKESTYDYQLETVEAGSYELPFVIEHYHRHQPFAGYLPLGLLLQGATDHYQFIWEHLKQCLTQFSMQGLAVGNGIITAPNLELLTSRVNNEERVREAIEAVDYLIRLKQRVK